MQPSESFSNRIRNTTKHQAPTNRLSIRIDNNSHIINPQKHINLELPYLSSTPNRKPNGPHQHHRTDPSLYSQTRHHTSWSDSDTRHPSSYQQLSAIKFTNTMRPNPKFATLEFQSSNNKSIPNRNSTGSIEVIKVMAKVRK
ncbi:hypothetical protein Droror1_Dr00017924 [Drosera rotundifolia]